MSQELEELKEEYLRLHSNNKYSGLIIKTFAGLLVPALVLFLLTTYSVINPFVVLPLSKILLITSIFGIIFTAIPLMREKYLNEEIKRLEKILDIRKRRKIEQEKNKEKKDERKLEPKIIEKMIQQKMEYTTPTMTQLELPDPLYTSTMEDLTNDSKKEDESNEEIEICQD